MKNFFHTAITWFLHTIQFRCTDCGHYPYEPGRGRAWCDRNEPRMPPQQ